LLRSLIEREALGWKELRQGDKGLRIEDVRIDFRDLNTGTGSAGGFLATSTSPTTLFEAVQAQTVCGKAGAQFPRPDGDWSNLPKRLTPATAYWVNPIGGVAPTESNGTFGLIPVSAKEVAANVDYTRNLQVQTNGLVERMLFAELTQAIAVGLDAAAFTGNGSASEPHGITSTSGIGSTSGATFSQTTALEMLRLIEAANFFPTAFTLSPTMAKLLRGREKVTDSGIMILGDDNRIAGIPCLVTTSMPDDTIIAGDFRKLLILAESLQLLVNRFTQARAGLIEVTAIEFCDIAVKNPAAFAVATDVT
jgi:HK97 family phage major capsid protein